jgi:hypothetical protein
VVDFTQYQPPGVYVQDTTTPLVNSTGSEATAVCLIGGSVGYQSWVEVINLDWDPTANSGAGAGVGVALSHRGVYMSSSSGGTSHTSSAIAAPVVTRAATGVVLVEGTDYSLSFDTTGGGGVANGVAYVTALASGLDGVAVVVAYNYADTSYTSPKLFTNYGDLAAAYGTPLALAAPANPNTSQVISPLSLAAKVAFENGATEVLTVALDPSISVLRDAFNDAYAKVETDFRVGTVVPILVEATPTTATTTLANVENLASDLRVHCVNASNEGFPRVGVFGATAGMLNTLGTAPAGSADFIALSAAVGNKRVMQAYPNVLNLYNGNTNSNIEVDGSYLAVAYAAQLANKGVHQGLTRVSVNSFSGIPARVQKLQTKSFKDSLSRAGVAVAEINRQNVLVCRHGVSTDVSSVLTREFSITRQNDALYYLLYDGIDRTGMVGGPITVDTVLSVKGVVVGILENAKANQIIVDYQAPAVRQQVLPTGDPTSIEVKFAWLPAVPLNYIVVSYAIDLNTGAYADITPATTGSP